MCLGFFLGFEWEGEAKGGDASGDAFEDGMFEELL